MEMNSSLITSMEFESSLNDLLDTYLGYVENVLLEEEIIEANRQLF